MPGIVLTFPILAGKVEAWRRFCQELYGSRLQLYEASRQRMGITREQLALVETAYGAMAVTTLEAPDVDRALGQIIASEIPFDAWYRERLQKLHGINLAGYEQFAQPTPLPQNQEVHFEWTVKSSVGILSNENYSAERLADYARERAETAIEQGFEPNITSP